MNNIEYHFFPGGAKRCVTFSYDDARIEDKRLVELFNKYNLKSTFHINGNNWQHRFDFLARDNAQFVDPSEYKELYTGHEISCHLEHHPFIKKIPRESLISEIYMNRRYLEEICGYPIRGMSNPFGSTTEEAIDIFKACGMEYARNVASINSFPLPWDFMNWCPTCHHDDAMSYIDSFFENDFFPEMKLFYIWGHSYEINTEEKWSYMENLCSSLANKDDTWYATNIEIVDYLNAMKRLKFTLDLSQVYNPSAISVWISVNGNPVEIKSGERKSL